MLDTKLIHSLPQIPSPVLTAYLNLNPADPRNQGHPPGYIIYLKSRGRVIAGRVPREERKHADAQFKRVEAFLRNRRPAQKGVVIFAGPKTWHVVPLQVQVEDELHWGAPSLTQLLWLLDEHQPCGVVFTDRSGARFFRFWLGEIEEQKKQQYKIDVSQWRAKHIMPPSNPRMQKTRGSQRDAFEQRIEAQFARFYRETAERVRTWAGREKLQPVFLAGPNEVVEPVWSELPRDFQQRADVIKGDLSHLSIAALQDRLTPDVERWKRRQEMDVVQHMIEQRNGRRAVVGIDATLRRLQEGMARELVVARGLGGKLRQCMKCGWVDRSADRTCAACGGERRVAALRAIVPELARRYSVPVEVVAGEAGRVLREFEGIGAWLR